MPANGTTVPLGNDADTSEVRATVPEELGNVIVRSAVGSVTVKVVSCASEVAPSNTMLLPVMVICPVTVTPAESVSIRLVLL